jgi:class 3 adenylate cyclase/tetratricopeptide (TPR) repeat protein
MENCSSCGAEQGPDARFCASCGAPQHALRDEQQERRVVTVLFSDLAGSTALVEQIDPEDVRRVQADLFDLLNAEVVRFGGTTEKFVGDAVLAVFGIPLAHEDDPERAVRAALSVHERFPAFAALIEGRYGMSVGLRTGINTGEVVSSRETAARGELIVSGDAVNVAARLQQNARPGEVLVGDRTHAATSRGVLYGPRRDVEAKGKSTPVSAWEARAIALEPAVRGSEFSAPLIGRQEELMLLEVVATRSEREQVPQLVTLFGPAGVGKTRLVSEFLVRFPKARVLQGRCLPYGEGITYWPLAEAAKADAEILDNDPVDVALGKLRIAVDAVVEQGATDVFDAIAWTIGFGDAGSPLSSMDSQAVGELLADGWQRYVAALGRSGLTVIVIEDIHWASAALLDLVEHLADRVADACVLLVCTARPEFLTDHPSWGAGKQNATSLSLTPLSADESEQLVSNLLGEAQVPEGVRRPLLTSAEGNPFFLEEMLQMLIDEGALERENGGWVATGRLAELRIPDSVHGVIAARLDLLDPDPREALRRCAVVGRVFWPAAVDVDEGLVAGLTRTGLVSLHPLSVMAGLQEFSFKHALTRDVAYGSLARPERRELHLNVAQWIQRVAPDRGAESAELAAYHYREAIGYGEDDPEVLHRAYTVLLGAGEASIRRAAFGAAQEHLESAFDLASSPDDKGTAVVALAEATLHSGRSAETLRWLDKADDIEGLNDLLRSATLGWRSRVLWLTGEWEQALQAANSAVAALDGQPESPQLARALARRSQIEMLRNRIEAVEHSEEAIAVAKRVGDPFAEVNARINLFTVRASNRGEPPDPGEVIAIVEQAAAAGAVEEAARAVVNWIWSALGFVPVDEIEVTALAGLDGRPPPPSVVGYVQLSVIAKLLVPAGRWAEADVALSGLDQEQMAATTKLLFRPTQGSLALRRGDLESADRWLAGQRALAVGSGEAQRILPMACAVFPWLHLTGRAEELREAADELVEVIEDQWPVVLTSDPIVRSLEAAGEIERLRAVTESLAGAEAPRVGRLANNLAVAEGLVALGEGRADEAVELLGRAAARERELGFAFDAACLALDHARALDAAGREDEAVRVRTGAEEFLRALDCVNAF